MDEKFVVDESEQQAPGNEPWAINRNGVWATRALQEIAYTLTTMENTLESPVFGKMAKVVEMLIANEAPPIQSDLYNEVSYPVVNAKTAKGLNSPRKYIETHPCPLHGTEYIAHAWGMAAPMGAQLVAEMGYQDTLDDTVRFLDTLNSEEDVVKLVNTQAARSLNERLQQLFDRRNSVPEAALFEPSPDPTDDFSKNN